MKNKKVLIFKSKQKKLKNFKSTQGYLMELKKKYLDFTQPYIPKAALTYFFYVIYIKYFLA